MVSQLTSFSVTTTPYGGDVRVKWSYPDTLPAHWKLLIFKNSAENATDQDVADYASGSLNDNQLADKKLFVFRELNQGLTELADFRVLNGVQYFYRACIQNTDTGEISGIADDDATPIAELTINVVDGKTLVLRGIEKIIDAIRGANGDKIQIPKNIRVLKSHSRTKQDDFFVVVSRTAGQNLERTFSGILAQYEDQLVRGEVDIDTFTVEWICIGDPARRDHFTDILRVMRPILRRYVMQMGNGNVLDVRMIMSGDGEGRYEGENAVKGTMTVALITVQQLQIGRTDLAPLGSCTMTYIGE